MRRALLTDGTRELLDTLPEPCGNCRDQPPPGFECNLCGATTPARLPDA